jgi:FtsP/CotA-like multicopper oxidase with cupredoxin domain
MSGISRREALLAGAAIGGAIVGVVKRVEAGGTATQPATKSVPRTEPRPTPAGFRDDGSVIVPNGGRLPWKIVGGVKVFHLVAEPVTHEIVPGLVVEAWGYHGRTPGPLIEVTEGDRCRFYVTNRLPEATSVHWHGVFVPNGMDGVGGLTQKPIAPGETFVYEFTFNRAGTFMYHPHWDEMTQIALGMAGMIVVHPKSGAAAKGVRDYSLLLHEWRIAPGARRPDPLAMNDFNVLTINGRSFPGTDPLLAQKGELVRLRMGNLSPMDHHPIHIHGHAFSIVETDGGPVPSSARVPETTILVPVGSVRVAELTAREPGDWPIHCHMTHHVMNQMGHALPNLIGVDTSDLDAKLSAQVPDAMLMGSKGMAEMGGMPLPVNSASMLGGEGPFGEIDMGGMFTLLKIRERLEGTSDPGWYDHPKGTVAEAATADQLARDGIDVGS